MILGLGKRYPSLEDEGVLLVKFFLKPIFFQEYYWALERETMRIIEVRFILQKLLIQWYFHTDPASFSFDHITGICRVMYLTPCMLIQSSFEGVAMSTLILGPHNMLEKDRTLARNQKTQKKPMKGDIPCPPLSSLLEMFLYGLLVK